MAVSSYSERVEESWHRFRDRHDMIDWEDDAIQLLAEEYDYDTALHANDFYRDNDIPEGSSAMDRFDKVKTRLHRIYPERFLRQEYSHDALNRLYSTVANTKTGSHSWDVSSHFYQDLDLSDYAGTDAIVLDHSTVYSVLNRRNHAKRLSTGDDDTGILFWDDTLDLLDEILTWNDQVVAGDAPSLDNVHLDRYNTVDIYHPGDLYQRINDGRGKHIPYEALPYLDDVADPLPLPTTVPEGEEDTYIAAAAKHVADSPLIVTLDTDFLAWRDTGEVAAASPDIANLAVRSLVDAPAENADEPPEFRQD